MVVMRNCGILMYYLAWASLLYGGYHRTNAAGVRSVLLGIEAEKTAALHLPHATLSITRVLDQCRDKLSHCSKHTRAALTESLLSITSRTQSAGKKPRESGSFLSKLLLATRPVSLGKLLMVSGSRVSCVEEEKDEFGVTCNKLMTENGKWTPFHATQATFCLLSCDSSMQVPFSGLLGTNFPPFPPLNYSCHEFEASARLSQITELAFHKGHKTLLIT